MNTDIETALAELLAYRESLDPVGLRREADAAVARVEAEAALADTRIAALQHGKIARAYLVPQLETAKTRHRDTMISARQVLCDELIESSRQRHPDAGELGRQENLKQSILAIDYGISDRHALNTLRLGELLRGAGFQVGPTQQGATFGEMEWHGSLPEIHAHIRRLEMQLAEAEARIADALLDDAGRQQQQADIAARNAQPQRKVRGDKSQYDRYPDGRVVEVETV